MQTADTEMILDAKPMQWLCNDPPYEAEKKLRVWGVYGGKLAWQRGTRCGIVPASWV